MIHYKDASDHKRKIEEIKDRLNIADVIGGYVNLILKGSDYYGLCPFHQEKTPSFSVVPDKGIFYCFGCQKGGDMFTFIMELESLSFPEALKLLAEKAGVDLEIRQSDTDRTRDAYDELYRRVAGSFHFILMQKEDAAEAREYLAKRKIGIETLETFQVGYAPADRRWLKRFLKAKRYSDEFLAGSKLFSERYPDTSFFSRRIMFPISSARGGIIGFGGRILGDGEPKYLNSPESDRFRKRDQLFGMHLALPEIRRRKEFILVEGYMDVLSLWEVGVRNAVAPLGTAFTEQQGRLLRRYADRAYLLFDEDSAGLQATRRAAETGERLGFACSVISVSGGKDPAEVLEKDGAEALQNLLKYSINSFEYLVKRAAPIYENGSPDQRAFVIEDLFTYVDTIDSEVRMDECIHVVADTLNMDRIAVRRDFAKRKGARVSPGDRARVIPAVSEEPKKLSTDLYLVLAAAANREHFPFVRSMVQIDDLQDPLAKDLFLALEECFRNDETSIELLLYRIENEVLYRLVLAKVASGEFALSPELMIRQLVSRIRLRTLDTKRRDIGALLRKAERDHDSEEIHRLLTETMYLDAELEKLKVNGHDRHTD